MKTIVSILIFFLSFGFYAQDFQASLQSENNDEQTLDSSNNNEASLAQIDALAFKQTAIEYDIPQREMENLENVENGFYVIAGVFSKDNKLNKLVKKHNKKGFDSGYIKNTQNSLNYFYLNHYTSWQKALEDCKSNFNGNFKDDVWLLKVNNSEQNKDNLTLEEVTYETLTANSTDTDSSIKAGDNTPKSRLIEKADAYFDKMWYAEAAKLYEIALSKNNGNYSYDVLQKAGDAHYFNTNMEQAYKWYTILYDKYKDDMSSDNIFKYAHSLKGTGKYARSKRLMRLYDKKLRSEISINKISDEQREAIVDELISTKDQFEVKNLNVNSKYSEFSPMFLNKDEVVFASAMDSSIFSTRRYKWDNQPYLDLYVSKLNEETSELKNAIKFSKSVNTKYHEASVTFSPNGETMYFTRNNYHKKLRRDKKGINHLKIYRSQKIDGKWTEATEVSFNSDDYSTGHPALSKDGKKMYFVSDMPGSIGETDIFVTDISEDGSFSTPRNLGPEVNTEQKEMFPFINEGKLYFSSNGHPGLGGLDVYEALVNDEGGFTDVKNLGKPINSNKDDFSYIINEETQKGYFASNRDGGKGNDDLYSFKKLIIEEIPENNNAIAGIVTDLITGDLMPKAMVELLDENNIKLKEVETSEDGSFIFEDLDSETRYNLRTNKETYFTNEQMVTTAENDTVNVDLTMRRLNDMIAIEDGIRKLKTEMIHFDFDKSYIRNDAAVELNKLVEVMTEYPDMVIKIESHTDSRGSKVYNEYLSDKRAKSTRAYIISQGIAPERIESAIGYGENRLLNECNGTVRCTEEQHYLNRRSEFIIVNM